jgi:hypothetical protein
MAQHGKWMVKRTAEDYGLLDAIFQKLRPNFSRAAGPLLAREWSGGLWYETIGLRRDALQHFLQNVILDRAFAGDLRWGSLGGPEAPRAAEATATP